MKIYIDNDYKCHTSNDGIMRDFDVSFFDDKCAAFIEGYRYIPDGETWMREDSEVFEGEMIAPFIDSNILIAYQSQYEIMKQEYAEQEQALNILIGNEVNE